MIKLKINNKEVEVKKGSTILAAAKKAGVFIPTLCHDERLTPYGACRLCLVAERRRPAKLIPSCFTPAREGMDIVTENPEILKSIKTQLQLILINHPLDCPVCDKSGECLLQKLVVRYDVTEAPYKLEKRQKPVDRLSPLIERDMNRCILCGRCVRICSELQGRHEIDFINRGARTVIGTDGMRPLNCDFCGQCISTCPVGALTDRTFKNTTRIWKLTKHQTICPQCGMGCSVDLNIQNGKIRRVTAPVSDHGNIGNLCARGRFGWKAYAQEVRSTRPQIRIRGEMKDASWPAALSYAAESLASIRNKYGAESIAVLSGDCLTTEEILSYEAFFRGELGTGNIGSTSASGYRQIMNGLIAAYGSSCKIGTMADLSESDILLVVGGGAVQLHPVLKTVFSKFLKKEGSELVVISAWPDFCWEKATLPVLIAPEYYENFLLEFCQALEGKSSDSQCDIAKFGLSAATFAKLVSLIHSGKEITLLAVPELFGGCAAFGQLVSILHNFVKTVIPLGAAVNSRSAVLWRGLSAAKEENVCSDAGDIFKRIESNKIKALYLMGDDPLDYTANSLNAKILLSKLELIIHQSPYLTPGAGLAHVVLPSAVLPEKNGSLVDMWGNEHIIKAALPPPGDVKTDADILDYLQNAWKKVSPAIAPENQAPAEETFLPTKPAEVLPYDKSLFPFVMIAVPCIYGDGMISRQSPEMLNIKGDLKIIMNTDDGIKIGIADESCVSLNTPYGKASGKVSYSRQVRPGSILVENVAGNCDGLNLISGCGSAVPANIFPQGGKG